MLRTAPPPAHSVPWMRALSFYSQFVQCMSLFLCRFSDAGMTKLSTRICGRRLKSAKARNRGAIAKRAIIPIR